MGHRHRGPPGRGRQRQQRLLAARARARLALRRALRATRAITTTATPTTSRCWRASASTPTASRSSGRASSRRKASSRAPRSTTTAACWTACHEHGLTPMVTFHHFTSPRWIAAAGGWEELRTAERFARFCERAMRAPRRPHAVACTLNEPNLGTLLHEAIGIPHPARQPGMGGRGRCVADRARAARPVPERDGPARGRGDARSAPARVRGDQGRAGRAAGGVDARHERMGGCPGRRGRSSSAYGDGWRTPSSTDVEGDFLGVQCYSELLIGPDGPVEPAAEVERTQMGYAVQARGAGAGDPPRRRARRVSR